MKLLDAIERYNRNWNMVRNAFSNGRIQPDRDDLFVCPQCLRWFPRELWNISNLSLEHVPPKSMGGKCRTITCTKCNNQSGSLLDAELHKELTLSEFFEGVANASIEAHYRLEGMTSDIVATITRPDSNTLHITGIPKRTDPAHLIEIRQLPIANAEDFRFTISIGTWKVARPQIAKLRIAYLWAFSIFGYSLLLNRSFLTIREQIMRPEDHILEVFPTLRVTSQAQNDYPIGVSIIDSPAALQGILVNFNLKRPQKTYSRQMILLPKPTHEGISELLTMTEGQHQTVSLDYYPDPIFEENPFFALTRWA